MTLAELVEAIQVSDMCGEAKAEIRDILGAYSGYSPEMWHNIECECSQCKDKEEG